MEKNEKAGRSAREPVIPPENTGEEFGTPQKPSGEEKVSFIPNRRT